LNDKSQALALPDDLLAHVKAAQRKFSTIAKRNGGAVNWPTEFEFARQIIARSKKLKQCVPQSITDAIINIAAIGLTLNPQRKHCALIPRWDSQLNALVCHADPMYQGLIALGTQSESILDVRCEVVREADVREGNFRYHGGTTPSVVFNPNPFATPAQRGEIIGAFCIAQIPNAHPHVTFMRIEEITHIRDTYSEMWKYNKSGPWKDEFEQMCLKTVLKRSTKTWPRRNEALDRAIAMSDEADGMRIQPRESDIEGEVVEVITESMLKEIEMLIGESGVKLEKVLQRFKIEKLSDLPRNEYSRCIALLKESKLIFLLRHATPDTLIYAEDYGLSFEQLEGKAADQSSRAQLLSKREAP
jgi:phage RecT family recombinase